MKSRIRKAVVLGGGNMGAQIAGHLAGAGVAVRLLDRVPEEGSSGDVAVRNRLAVAGVENLRRSRPPALYVPELAQRITPGNFDDHLGAAVAEADWIVEAVVERLDIKKPLLARVDEARRPGVPVSSNTSGLSIRAMAEGRSEDFRRHFLGTHFFNPVRYMHLLEIIPGRDTSPEVIAGLEAFCDRDLGKGVVHAKDTPNFIANRIGTFAALHTIHFMLREGYTVEEVDLLTGPAVGHPKTASFRLADLVGVDVLAYVAQNLHDKAEGDEMRDTFRPPQFLRAMLANGWLGNKAGQGFYKKVRQKEGPAFLALDIEKMEYRPQIKPALPAVDEALQKEDVAARLRALVAGSDRAARFIWETTAALVCYAARRVPEIADDIVNIDRAMRWGYNWELGPFETWDALGLRESVARMSKEGREVPASVEKMLAAGHASFYERRRGKTRYFDLHPENYQPFPQRPGVILLPALRERKKVVCSNAGASLLDLGDGVACLEFHTKMNAIGAETIEMVAAAVDKVRSSFEGLVVGNQGPNFSVGANIYLLVQEAQNENWQAIEAMIRAFQDAAMSLRYSDRPVVAAPFGMTLGGGCEMSLACDRMRAAADTFLGLVETGVGLIPGGSGCKEMILRAGDTVPAGSEGDFFPHLKRVFETVAMARASTSALDARRMGFLRDVDGISTNRDRLIQDAKTVVLDMVREGYRRPEPRNDLIALGEPALASLKLGIHMLLRGGFISEHDALVGRRLAQVLTGGAAPRAMRVNEQHFLDLEREAFLSLCGEPKTQERIQFTLKTGKPLRN